MLNERHLKTERDLIGEIWQTSEIHKNMLVLADEIGSRFAGTPSEKQAQEYMVDKLKEYGYENARAVPFKYYGWRRGPATLEMTEPVKRGFEAISLAMSPGGTMEADVINLGTGSPEEFEAVGPEDVKGKIVLCSSATSPTGKRVHRRTKYGYAVKYGAVGFIFMNHNPGQLAATGSLRPSYRMGGEIPGIGVSLETGSLIQRLAGDRPLRVKFSDESEVVPDSESANIVAELPGRSDEWIVVGGHYDGHDIAQGAMDNLSGTAVTMELARVLKPYEGKFKRGIRFICFGCEEIGVTGSTSYVADHLDQMKKTAIMVNLELGGLAYTDGMKHAAFTVYQPPEMKQWIEEFLKEVAYATSITTGMSAASDHWPFVMQGVPAIYMHEEPSMRQFVQGRGWGHTTADSMDKVDSRNLQEGAMLMARLLLRLATQRKKIAKHTPLNKIVRHLERTGMRKTLEIQLKWHPESPR
ncbi:M20/M25/M40 family metallo-hydrolase [Candidatus Bathyarchaeota archaeon]|nr:M20/M25/M40 family metallo-hydrolase [Candidatus Bathyarchaeota archaeon]MBL7169206.1 M20/M25/M40 family metallo-hydrolase [Candidatus Bathyarchaeota archaeon]